MADGRLDRNRLRGGVAVAAAFTVLFAPSARAQEAEKPSRGEARVVAVAVESAFIHISEAIGPATVRIMSAASPTSAAAASDDADFDNLFPPGARRSPPGAGRRRMALGSGVIIRPEGYILTNDHVVEEAVGNTVTVTLSDNSTYAGTVVRDPLSDLALVRINAGHPLPFVKMADSSHLHVGQWAIAIGSPFDQQNTMTAGIVSALHRKQDIPDGTGDRYYTDLIQTDASINPGNSGGPLLNIDGELIGINVAILSRSGTSAGVGFAIPANTARTVAGQLILKGKVTRSTLGILPADIPPYLRAKLGTEHGAYVNRVNDNTPAALAGLQPGDVITRFGEADIDDEVALRNAISFSEPNRAIPITVLRSGKTQSLSATLAARDSALERREAPPLAGARPATVHRSAQELGFTLRPITPDLASEWRLKAGAPGAFVATVVGGSPAGDAGLERMSIITHVDGVAVVGPEGVDHVLSAAKSGDVVTLTVFLPSVGGIAAAHAVVDIQIP